MSDASRSEYGSDAEGSPDEPTLTAISRPRPTRKKGPAGEVENIWDGAKALALHVIFPEWRSGKEDKRSGRSMRIFIFIDLVVIGVAHFWRHMSPSHLCVVILSGAVALACECVNTTFETICDRIEPNEDDNIALIKHLASTPILMAVLAGVIPVCILMFLYPR